MLHIGFFRGRPYTRFVFCLCTTSTKSTQNMEFVFFGFQEASIKAISFARKGSSFSVKPMKTWQLAKKPRPIFLKGGWTISSSSRRDLLCFKSHIETEYADHSANENKLTKLKQLVNKYHAKDIFNANECALFYRMVSDRELRGRSWLLSYCKKPQKIFRYPDKYSTVGEKHSVSQGALLFATCHNQNIELKTPLDRPMRQRIRRSCISPMSAKLMLLLTTQRS